MKKISIYGLFLGLLFTSCATVIPNLDTRLPEFVFLVRGDGISEQLDEDFDFDNTVLYLKRGDTYTVNYTGSDAGGVRQIMLEMPQHQAFANPSLISGNDWFFASTSSSAVTLLWEGRRTEPTRGSTVVWEFGAIGLTSDNVDEVEFIFTVIDFHDNTIRKTLTIRIYNQDPQLAPR